MWKRFVTAALVGALTLTASGSSPFSTGDARGLAPAPAEARVSIAHTLEELVDDSPLVVVAVPLERKSVWERVGDSKRIVTYTRLSLEDSVYGEPSDEIWVRTLGGVVGKIGQHVAGEAELEIGRRSVTFLHRTSDDKLVVMGAAQGHFPIVEDDDSERLSASRALGKVLRRDGPSVTVQEALVGLEVADAIDKIRAIKKERDAERKKRQ